MLFRIVGANPQTGRSIDMTLDAPDAQTAKQMVTARGMVVTSVTPAVPGTRSAPAAAPPRRPASAPPSVAAPPSFAGPPIPATPPRPRTQPTPQPNRPSTPAPISPPAVVKPAPPRFEGSLLDEAPDPMVDLTDAAQSGAPGRKRFNWRALKTNLLIVGVVGAIVLVVCGLWMLGIFSGAPVNYYKRFIPANATSFGFIDVNNLRHSDFYKDLESTIKPKTGTYIPPGLDSASEMFVAATGSGEAQTIRIYRTVNVPLETKAPETVIYNKVEDVDYIKVVGTGYIAKLSSDVFCVSPNEELVKDTIRRSRGKLDAGAIDETMQRALERVKGEHSAVVVNGKSMGAGAPKAMAFGFSASSTLAVRSCMIFNSASDADVFMKAYDLFKAQAKIKSASLPMLAGADLNKLFDGVHMSMAGEMITATGEWKYEDVKGITSQARAFADMGNPPPAPPPQPPSVIQRPPVRRQPR